MGKEFYNGMEIGKDVMLIDGRYVVCAGHLVCKKCGALCRGSIYELCRECRSKDVFKIPKYIPDDQTYSWWQHFIRKHSIGKKYYDDEFFSEPV